MANEIRDDVRGILLFLGFLEVREAGGEWGLTADVGSAFGTTSETTILHRKHDATASLVDRQTAEVVGVVRRSCPLQWEKPAGEGEIFLAETADATVD